MVGLWNKDSNTDWEKTHSCRKLCWWFLVSQFQFLPSAWFTSSTSAWRWMTLFITTWILNKPGISDRMAADKIYEHKLACNLIAGCQKRALSQIRAWLYKMELVELNLFYCTYGSFLNDQIATCLRTSPENAAMNGLCMLGSDWELRIVRSMQFQSQHIEKQYDLKCHSALWQKKMDWSCFQAPILYLIGKSFRKAVIAQVTQAFLNVLWVLGPPKLKDWYYFWRWFQVMF